MNNVPPPNATIRQIGHPDTLCVHCIKILHTDCKEYIRGKEKIGGCIVIVRCTGFEKQEDD